MIAAIVAFDKHRLIGANGKLPWHYPEDLAYFKNLTKHHTVLMGRHTYESILKTLGKPLPLRQNVVISSQLPSTEGIEVITDLKSYLASWPNDALLFIIGGAHLYRAALPYCDRLYITHIDAVYEGDTYFPPIDETQWRISEQTHSGPLRFTIYERSSR